ncbi:aspartyl protease family protein [Pedobacter nyackensis]|uniref:Aspartyl protease n=1 Tax=Pedobacter nyackensis TaxID=475255 RepID=A0A1W2F0C9_9SPHI|nr:aspartyl protease family protein [Pedobacter nyackensis]SMD15399.1 Aspartyl protease [Pedobacter nyackensis]
MKNKFYLAAFFMLLGFSCADAQDAIVSPDTIPFQYQNNMIIVKVDIKGRPRNFFFDTGAPTLVSKELQQEMNLVLDSGKAVTDASSKTTEMKGAKLSSLKIGNLKLHNVPVTVFDMHRTIPQLACLNIEGFLGLDVFKQNIVQIDLQNKRLIISGSSAGLKPDERFGNKMIVLKAQNSVLVELKFGKVFIENALFDTGMTGGLYSIANQTYKYVNQATPLDPYIVARGYGAASKVASGTEAESEKIKLKFEELSIGQAIIKHPIVNTGNHPYSLLGVQLLKYGKVTLDFINERFYFEPLVQNAVALIGKTAGFDLKIEGNDFFVGIVWKNSVAEKAGVKTGYKIIEYGSKKVENLTQEGVCKVLLGDTKDGRIKEKKTLRLKFLDDKGKVRLVSLPMVEVVSLKE